MFGRIQSKKPYKEILPNFYYFSEGTMLDCNIYGIKTPQGKIALIDMGNGLSYPALKESFHEIGWSIQDVDTVILTHDHLDHLMGLYKLFEDLDKHPPKVYGHPYTITMLEKGNENEIIPPLFGVSAHTFNITVIPLQNGYQFTENETLAIGDYTFDIKFCPGHSIGSVCLIEKTHKLLISGDVVFPEGSFGRYDFPGCSLRDLKQSIATLAGIDTEILCAGHMPPVLKQAKAQIQRSFRNISMM